MGQKLEENLTILKDQKSYGEIQKYLLLVHHIAVFHDMNWKIQLKDSQDFFMHFLIQILN